MDKILKAEVFIHKDGQLRAAHLILNYTLILSNFQAPKCQIEAKDPCLHLINIAMPGFLNLSLGPQGALTIEPILQCKTKDAATPLQPTIERKEEEEEKVVEIFDSEDDFKVFNQP